MIATLKSRHCTYQIHSNQCFNLPPKAERPLPKTVQHVRIIVGSAWITHEGRDYILNHGDELSISHGKHPAVISALGRQQLVYTIY